MLALQVVEILWTKATRSAPRSNERAALSRAFPFDVEPAEYVVQHFRLAEWEGAFAPELVKVTSKPAVSGSEGALRIQAVPNGSFKFGFLGTPNAGQPKRKALPETFTLLPGEYARLVVNARHATYSGQYYSETIYNITCGPHVAADRFLQGHPEHELDLKANLF